MSAFVVGLALFAGMLALMAARVPIAISMFVPGALGFAYLAGPDALLNHLKGLAYARMSVYDLSVIPLFLLMGQFATQGGLSKALFGLANAMIGHFRGGMAMAAVLACAAFGSICGSSVATAATVTQVALPEMRRHHYSGRLATATLAAGGTLGILIPPSVVLVVYGILAEQKSPSFLQRHSFPASRCGLYSGDLLCMHFPGSRTGVGTPHERERLAMLLRVWPVAAIFLCVRWHLRRSVHPHGRCRGGRGVDARHGDGQARARRAGSHPLLPGHCGNDRHDLHDLSWRGHAQLGARAVANARRGR
jgi:hypothetical protein